MRRSLQFHTFSHAAIFHLHRLRPSTRIRSPEGSHLHGHGLPARLYQSTVSATRVRQCAPRPTPSIPPVLPAPSPLTTPHVDLLPPSDDKLTALRAFCSAIDWGYLGVLQTLMDSPVKTMRVGEKIVKLVFVPGKY